MPLGVYPVNYGCLNITTKIQRALSVKHRICTVNASAMIPPVLGVGNSYSMLRRRSAVRFRPALRGCSSAVEQRKSLFPFVPARFVGSVDCSYFMLENTAFVCSPMICVSGDSTELLLG